MSSMTRSIQRSVERKHFSRVQVENMQLFAYCWNYAKKQKSDGRKNGRPISFSFVKTCNKLADQLRKQAAKEKAKVERKKRKA